MSDYGVLRIPVTADTKQLTKQVASAATSAGNKAGSEIAGKTSKGLARLGPVAGQLGKSVATGLGLASTAAVAFGVKSYKAFEESRKVAKQTGAVLKSTGGAANVTAAQITRLTGAIMAKTGIDDEAVRSGANMLLTFRNIRNETGKGNDVFNQATGVLTDMTAALHGGQVTQESMRKQAIGLGKALNDPIKGITSLSRVGVSFTAGQKEQITALTESGHKLAAQKIILGELNKEFKGSAASQATFTQRIKTTWGELQESVGGALAKAIDPALGKLGLLASKFGAAVAPGGKLAPIFHAIGDAVSGLLGPFTKLIDLGSKWIDRLKPSQVNAIAGAIERFGPALGVAGAAAAAFTGGGLLTQLPIIGPMLKNLVGPIGTLIGKMGGLSGAFKFMTGPLGIFLGLLATAMAVSPKFRKGVMDLVMTLIQALLPAFMSIGGVLKELAPILAQVGRILGGVLGGALEGLVPLVQVLGSVLGALAPILPFLVKSFLAIYAAVKIWAAVQWVLDAAMDASPLGLWTIAIIAVIAAVVLVVKHFQLFRKIAVEALNAIKGAIQAVWRWVVGASTAVWNAVRGAIMGELNRIKQGFLTIFGWIKGFVQGVWHWFQNTATSVWNTIRSTIINQLQRILQGYVNIWNTIKGLWTRGWNALISTVTNLGGRLVSLGSTVIHNFLTGMGNAIKGIGSWIKSHVVDPVIDAVKHFFGIHSPSSVMADLGSNVTEGFISGLVRQNPLTIAKTVFGGIPAALGHMVVKGLIGIAGLPGKAISALGHLGGWFGNLLGGVGGFFGKLFGGGGSPGVAHWSGLVSTVLGMLGLPASYLGPWLSQMSSESGGNPNAINLTDINAQQGHPSQGLLQTIPSTFAAYAGPFAGRGITDPLANIYAAINYALHRYGRTGMLGVIGHGHGYAAGGVLREPVLGFGLRSGDPYSFGENAPRVPEMWSPLHGQAPQLGGSSAHAVVINVYPQRGQSETEIAAAVSRRLGWAEATGAT